MNKGPIEQENQPVNQRRNQHQLQQFRLRDNVPDSLHYRLMTTMPRATYIDKLWNIAETVSNDITFCLNMLYCQVTQRNGSGEGQPHYFYHVGATSIYETSKKKLIKGKNHSLKAGDVLLKITKTLDQVKKELEKEDEKENTRILKYYKAELSAQYNVLLFSLQNAPEKTHEHLSKFKSLDVTKLEAIKLTTKQQKRVMKLHPKPAENTPKKTNTFSNKNYYGFASDRANQS